jgi:DNA-directed RNA polymerase subunit K/omega
MSAHGFSVRSEMINLRIKSSCLPYPYTFQDFYLPQLYNNFPTITLYEYKINQQIPVLTQSTNTCFNKINQQILPGTRALQISLNAPILCELNGETDPLEIAEKELRLKKVPFIIRRKLPNGETEDWRVADLIDPQY